jgi:hypothetical protein
MIRAAALALLLSACAVARVSFPGGVAIDGVAVGRSAVTVCTPAGRMVASADGAFVVTGACTSIRGGAVSSTLADMLAALATAAATVWGYGAL